MSIVGLDNVSVMNLMMEQLLDYGHKRIVYINDIAIKDIDTIRKKVFTEFLIQNKLPSNRNTFLYLNPLVLNSGKEDLKAILKIKKEKPSVIICQSVSIATSVVQMLDNLGINVPKDLSIAVFGLKEQEQEFFSSVDYSGENYAQEIIDSLLLQINGNGAPKKIQVMSEFVERKSSRNINPASVMAK